MVFAEGGPMLRACIWDRDTVKLEARLFPETLEVMTGQFPRHSAEFYQWRIDQTRRLVAEDAGNLALRDDLAVALHKLGRHDEAITLLKGSLALQPRRYETLSNLGTFAIYAGDLAASRQWLKEALEINPEAHFGREKYQLWLVEQVMLKRDPSALPDLTAGFSAETIKLLQDDYARFVQLQLNLKEGWARDRLLRELTSAEQSEAVTGVVGMMRFADFDNPLLQTALGDLLALEADKVKASRLAVLAYEHALMKTRDPIERDGLLAKMQRALPSSASSGIRINLVKKLDANLVAGRTLAAQVRADELTWIRERRDVEREFEKKYLGDFARSKRNAD